MKAFIFTNLFWIVLFLPIVLFFVIVLSFKYLKNERTIKILNLINLIVLGINIFIFPGCLIAFFMCVERLGSKTFLISFGSIICSVLNFNIIKFKYKKNLK